MISRSIRFPDSRFPERPVVRWPPQHQRRRFETIKYNLGVLIYADDGSLVRESGGSLTYRADDDTETRGWEPESGYSNGIGRIGSYAVVDLMAHYAFDKHLALTLRLNNAFDKLYVRTYGYHDYGPERSLSATLKYPF